MITYYRRHGGRRLQKRTGGRGGLRARAAVLFLCLSMLMGGFHVPALAADPGEKLSDIVIFDSITLHYAADDGLPGDAVPDRTLLDKNAQLVLRYEYTVDGESSKNIQAGTKYLLDVSSHLVLPADLQADLYITERIDQGDGTWTELEKKFGTLCADGVNAWVIFLANEAGNGTVLSDYGGIENAYFYLDCGRAGNVPGDAPEEEKNSNLYAIKVEQRDILRFGYAEDKPVVAKAQINKGGSLADKTITWTIVYTPWQNPAGSDFTQYQVDLNTPFELRDTIDTGLHSYVGDSLKIDGTAVSSYDSRDDIPEGAETYLLAEEDGGKTTLTVGGTKFNAVKSTAGSPAQPLNITYRTTIRDELLLPGGTGGQKVANAAELFAGPDFDNQLGISGRAEMTVKQPVWLTKEGETTRHTDGTGSHTDWTVTFKANGFTFDTGDGLTLHDQLPPGSTLETDSVEVNGTKTTAALGADNDFTISQITTDQRDVTITYRTTVPETMYDEGTSLSSNTAWFTFDYNGNHYKTPEVTTAVGSGDGSHTPGTDPLVKSDGTYNPKDRTIQWTVKINPHQAYLKSGTLTDDLGAVGPRCNAGHDSGLMLENGVADIKVSVEGGVLTDGDLVLGYEDQKITVTVGEIGTKIITLTYTTKVCDPCIFANNRAGVELVNTISGDMMIGRTATEARSVSDSGKAVTGATVLTKKPPVYSYETGMIKWEVEVDGAGLPMADVVLKDTLPAGLTYEPDSLGIIPKIENARASAAGQELTITLGEVTEKTTVTFDTSVDPEILGFDGDKPVVVKNTIRMSGSADKVVFAEVSHSVEQSFSNHGLVKKSTKVENREEFIQYEVLINPYRLALPENPSLVDTLDKRLQLDPDTLLFYRAEPTGTTGDRGVLQPGYRKQGDGQAIKLSGFDPETNSFTVQLPIGANDRGAYVLAYTADIVNHQAGGYGNSVRFDGGTVLLGGGKTNSASVGGGGGGGGGGIAARKAAISVTKLDSETKDPIPGVSFTLYQWDAGENTRGLPFARGTTDAQGKLSFRVKPGAAYELVETESAPGYGSAFGWISLPGGVTETKGGLLVTAGAAASTLDLELTNQAHTADIVFHLFNKSGIPMAGVKVHLFKAGPVEGQDPDMEFTVDPDGTVRFSGVRRGANYVIRPAGGEIMTVTIPADPGEETKITLADGTEYPLTPDYQASGAVPEDQLWALTVTKVVRGSGAPLAGASIGLYADENGRTQIKEEVSGADGTVTFDGLMAGQTYWVKEIVAPNGYQLNSTLYEGDEGASGVTIENEPSPVNPGGSGENGGSGGSSWPNVPAGPGSSGRPGISGTADQSDIRDGPAESGHPAASGDLGGDSVTGGVSIPQTGDSTPYLAAVAAISGVLLVVMTACRSRFLKKREDE